MSNERFIDRAITFLTQGRRRAEWYRQRDEVERRVIRPAMADLSMLLHLPALATTPDEVSELMWRQPVKNPGPFRHLTDKEIDNLLSNKAS